MITLRNLTLRRGTKVLLDNVSVTLNPTTSPTTSTINFPAGDVRAAR